MRDEQILKNENLIYAVLKKMGLYNQRDEYYDIGMIHLIKAVDSYDVNKGYNFSTYAFNCIKYGILIEIRKDNSNKRKINNNTISLDTEINRGSEKESIYLKDFLKSNVDIEKDFLEKESKIELYKSICLLDDIEIKAITSYYGLYGSKRIKQIELAKMLGLSQSKVCRMIKKTENKIKKYLEKGDVL